MANFLSDEQTVGTLLRQEREKQRKTIQDISKETHIRVAFLEYIEEDRFEELPSKLHITGFIQVYSNALGLDDQEMLVIYKKQMYLEQDIPAEEIFSISQDYNLAEKRKKNKVILPLLLVLFVIGIIFLGLQIFTQYSTQKDPENVLNVENGEKIFFVATGDKFSFSIKNYSEEYQVINILDKSVTLSHLGSETTLPSFLYSEAIQYDLDDNHKYDYTIEAQEQPNNDQVKITVKLVDIIRNPGQLNYAIVQQDQHKIVDILEGDIGFVYFKNMGTENLSLLKMGNQKERMIITLNPMEEYKIALFNSDREPKYESIYIQNVKDLAVTHNNGIKVPLSRSNPANGTIGVLLCSLVNKSSESTNCQVGVGKF